MSNLRVALDAGHGGSDPGAKFNNRQEKDDVLRLTRAVGEILENSGIDVYYVRNNDEYETPFKKATDANNAGADLFVSIHRNSSEYPNQYSGIETLVFNDDGSTRSVLARNINNELENVGFYNIGVTERPNLVVLRRTQMPAALVEVGFINTDKDNQLFDNSFNQIAQAIANGILQTVYSEAAQTSAENAVPVNTDMPDNTFNNNMNSNMNNDMNNNMDRNMNAGMDNNMNNNMYDDINNDEYQTLYPDNTSFRNNNQPCICPPPNNAPADDRLYRVQVGSFQNKDNADRMLNSLLMEGFPAFIIYDDGLYKVQSGAFVYLTNAIKMEQRLRRFRYNTYIVYN